MPFEIPSVTLTVVYSNGVPPAALTPARTASDCDRNPMLHGDALFHVVKTPTSGWSNPPFATPVPYIIARDGAWCGPCVTWRLGRPETRSSFDITGISHGNVAVRLPAQIPPTAVLPPS